MKRLPEKLKRIDGSHAIFELGDKIDEIIDYLDCTATCKGAQIEGRSDQNELEEEKKLKAALEYIANNDSVMDDMTYPVIAEKCLNECKALLK